MENEQTSGGAGVSTGSRVITPRRRDRGKDDRWIREFLDQALYGFLATVEEGGPALNSNLFVHDAENGSIYMHTARTGRTPENVARGGPATFSTATIGRFLPASEALEFSVEYAAVVVSGRIRAVSEEGEKRRALELLMQKYAGHLHPGRDYRPVTGDEIKRTAVHRLDVEAWSGKEKVEAEGFPGAYTLPGIAPPLYREAEHRGAADLVESD
ncbi:MAG: pyridoxamine 5'-phosphate oxidase family protein [Gemmatimonadota bacterium]